MSKEHDEQVSELIGILNNAIRASLQAGKAIETDTLLSALLNMLGHHFIVAGYSRTDAMAWLAQAWAVQWNSGSRPRQAAIGDA